MNRSWGRATAAILAAGVALGTGPARAADLDTVLEVGEEKVLLAQASQERVDEVVDETRGLEADYKALMKEIDGLEIYAEYMDRQIENQNGELADLRASIDQVSTVERQIMPLMIRMLDGLEQFVELDLPFLLDERRDRVARLRGMMERADLSVAEKFRQLTEAFQIETDFGRTIETYPESLSIEGATLEVDMLRIGRVGLYYQTSDASLTGRWDHESRSWVLLDDSQSRNQVRQGLRIARKQVAPDLLLLPIQGAEVSL